MDVYTVYRVYVYILFCTTGIRSQYVCIMLISSLKGGNSFNFIHYIVLLRMILDVRIFPTFMNICTTVSQICLPIKDFNNNIILIYNSKYVTFSTSNGRLSYCQYVHISNRAISYKNIVYFLCSRTLNKLVVNIFSQVLNSSKYSMSMTKCLNSHVFLQIRLTET